MTEWVDILDGVREGMLQTHEATLRDQFAMAALQSMHTDSVDSPKGIARRAYELADALMIARLDPPR